MERDPDFLKHFNLLKSIGIVEELDRNNKKIQTLETILVHAWEIFTKDSVASIIDYVKGALDELFIPQELIFIVKNQAKNDKLDIFAYTNLKPRSCKLDLKTLNDFSPFFAKHPNTINYDLFEYTFKNKKILEKLPKIKIELVVPIVGFSSLYGIILFGEKMLGKEYTKEELSYIDKMMKMTSVAIQNTLHYQSSVRDLKTGLYNHTFFYNRLIEEAARAKRYDKKYGILLLDIDHFKNLNDTHGHLAGDEVLIKMSQVLEQKLRKTDVLARFGGEEFVVLIPETTIVNLFLAAERIRDAIENLTMQYKEIPMNVTISLGGACYNSFNKVSHQHLLDQADKAMYSSKSKGRNCTTIFNPGFLLQGIFHYYKFKDKEIMKNYNIEKN